MKATAYSIAERFVGISETEGAVANPAILAMLRLDSNWPKDDATPWCSAFVNYVAWLLRLPRSKSLAARSWLGVGQVVPLAEAVPGFDVVIFRRGTGVQPGADVINAPGHVGFFSSVEHYGGKNWVWVLGGNQGDSVSLARYPELDVLGVRRLFQEE